MIDQPTIAPDRARVNRSSSWWSRGFLAKALIALAGVAALSGSCFDACTGMNTIRRVPAFHGRVVDGATGQPIAGVRVTRWFDRDTFAGFGGTERHRVKSSLRTVTSDAGGRFELPAWYGVVRGISKIEWTEYKPGWVAGWGTLSSTNPPTLSVAQRHPPQGSVQAMTRPDGSGFIVTLQLSQVNSPSAAEDHFWALRILLEDDVVQEDDFVKDALSYSDNYEVTLELFKTFDSVAVDLGGHRDDRPCYKANLAWTMLDLEERLCAQHSEWRFCTAGGLERSRDFLQRNCPTFRR